MAILIIVVLSNPIFAVMSYFLQHERTARRKLIDEAFYSYDNKYYLIDNLIFCLPFEIGVRSKKAMGSTSAVNVTFV
jgi:hypothetical protein